MTKILLVEDNEMNRDMLGRRLQRRGYEVLIAVDGAEGVAMAQRNAPDLILMDMSLPVLDGWEATRHLKAAPETQAIPIIALTAHAMSGDREKAIEAGCDDYDTKPIELSRLLAKVETLLSRPIDEPGGDQRPVPNEPIAAVREAVGKIPVSPSGTYLPPGPHRQRGPQGPDQQGPARPP